MSKKHEWYINPFDDWKEFKRIWFGKGGEK